MAKKEKEVPKEQTITYDNKEYKVSLFTEEEIDDFNHSLDLQNKVQRAAFNLRQINGSAEHYKSKNVKAIERVNEEKK
tara:strand:- start:253 stop:486 length:234 start_codon:yes stop_codon:yes gene_type:complete